MQALLQKGVNYFYIDQRLLDGFTLDDPLKIELSKKGCTEFYYPVDEQLLCENELGLTFDLKKCLPESGEWTISILNDQDDVLYKGLVMVHKNKK